MDKIFKYNDNEIRTIKKDDDIWFIAKDVCDVLGLKNNTSLIKIPSQNKDTHIMSDTTGRRQEMTIINEPAIYQLVFKSKKQEAIQFQQWIYNDVLPQIRKTGKYAIPDKIPFKTLSYKMETEYDLHTKIVNYIRTNHSDVLMISGLINSQDTDEKRIRGYIMGYQKGTPDLIINEITARHNGLAIEFKAPNGNGRISDEQLIRIAMYKTRNYKIIISNDYDHVLISIYNYLNKRRLCCPKCIKRFKKIETLNNHLKFFHRLKTD